MKKMALLLLMAPFVLNANDTIQLLLESKGISTENFKKIGDSIDLSGSKLIDAINQMRKKEILIAYITTDHESELGVEIADIVPQLFKTNTSNSTGIIFPHYIFDGRRYSGEKPIQQNPNDDISHYLQHRDDVIKVKKLALNHCNKNVSANTPHIPIFTAPQNLVDIIYYANRSNVNYTLHDGSTFHCIGDLTIAQ